MVSLENQPKRGTNSKNRKEKHEPIYAWNPSKALVRVLQALRELDLRYLGLQKYQEGFGDAGQLRVGWERGNYASLPGLKREPMMKISSFQIWYFQFMSYSDLLFGHWPLWVDRRISHVRLKETSHMTWNLTERAPFENRSSVHRKMMMDACSFLRQPSRPKKDSIKLIPLFPGSSDLSLDDCRGANGPFSGFHLVLAWLCYRPSSCLRNQQAFSFPCILKPFGPSSC